MPRGEAPANSRQGNYRDFVIAVRRIDARKVGVSVEASPAGRLETLVTVVYPEKEGAALRKGFLSSIVTGRVEGGRGMITSEEALVIGKRLSGVLFPPDVFRLFAASLA